VQVSARVIPALIMQLCTRFNTLEAPMIPDLAIPLFTLPLPQRSQNAYPYLVDFIAATRYYASSQMEDNEMPST
jgi:hypothetical protein